MKDRKKTQEKIFLVPLELKHISDDYLSWVNDSELTKFLEIGERERTVSDLEDYITNSPKEGRTNFAIFTEESKTHIGNGSIYDVDITDMSYEIGWFIGNREFHGGLYAPMIIYYLHKIAILEMDLKKCRGVVIKENVKARISNKFVGYKQIGDSSYFHKKNQTLYSVIELELLREDYLARREEIMKMHPNFFD